MTYCGDEALIRRLTAILLDNALKYCDPGGTIQVSLCLRRHPVLTVENTYAEVGTLELERLLDRFYRADRARTFSGSFGVGLSIAQSIAKKHRGSITAYRRAPPSDSGHLLCRRERGAHTAFGRVMEKVEPTSNWLLSSMEPW